MNRRAILAGTAAAAVAVIPPVLACDKQPSDRDRFLALAAEPDGELFALGAFMKLDLPELYEARSGFQGI
jgi:hypothetical protein